MKLLAFAALLSSASAFFNMDEVDFKSLDVNTFDFQMVYGMDILALKWNIISESTYEFMNLATEI